MKMRSFLILVMVWLCSNTVGMAQNLTALARIDPDRSKIEDVGGDVELQLGLSVPVPFRVFTLDAPRRLVVDFSEVDWTGITPEELDQSAAIETLAMGGFQPGWSRLVATLAAPYVIETAELITVGDAQVRIKLTPASEEEFTNSTGAVEHIVFSLPDAEQLPEPRPRPTGDRPLRVALDPGHGGIDPGAQRGGFNESNLMLLFAKELQEVLLRSGFEVILTREKDVFVPLDRRQSIARANGADVFLSLHADAVAQGRAQGATVYTLSAEASDLASKLLAERHDRGDLLAGVDLSKQDDVIAGVLMDLARQETAPRTARLADALVDGLRNRVGGLHKRPKLEAAFSVLKAADIPSVLIELGFMSSSTDLSNLRTPEWRQKAALGIRDALQNWAIEDAAEAELLRQ